jgi:chromosome segregation protein
METRKYESEFAQSAEKEKEIINGIEAFREKRKALIEEEQKYESQISRESRELEVLNPEIINLEKSILEVKVKEEQLRESLYQDYELHFDEAQEKIGTENEDISLINKRIAELKSSISSLGIINHLALAEYEELKERFEFYTNQFQDLDKARADIFKLIKDIDSVSAKLFIEAFEKIRKSFSEIFKRLFEGGSADIKLVEDNPLEAGIDIIVQPPGKNPKHLSLLSGGEKTLIAISLLFATYNLRPSPFCFLDEIDAALDESNIDRFINLMSHFAQKSQFIVITHNKRTMSMAKTIYGVTMEQPGISKLISMILEKKEEKREGDIIIN